MKKKVLSTLCICLLALHAFWCDPGDDGDLIAFLVDLPAGVKDVDAYGESICTFVSNYSEKHDIIQAYYKPRWKPAKTKK